MRNLDAGDQSIDNSGLKARLQAVAQKIHVRALLTAVLLTALTFLLR
jgi:hypothetical protein